MAEQPESLPRRCAATTARGKPCKLWPVEGSDRCATHLRSAAAQARQQDGRVAPASRPAGITEDLTANLERLLSAGNYVAIACQVVGLARSTYQEWMLKGTRDGAEYAPYRVFAQRIEAAMAKGEATRVAQIAKAASGDEGDWRAAAWMLERQAPERWAKPSQRAHAESEAAKAADGAAAQGSPLLDLLSQMRQQQVTPGQG